MNEPILDDVLIQCYVILHTVLCISFSYVAAFLHRYCGVLTTNGVSTMVFQTRMVFQKWCFEWGYTSCLRWYFETPLVVLFSNSSGVLYGFSKRQWCFV
jgi:hypothetical protein